MYIMKLISRKSISYIFTLAVLGFVAYYFIHNWKSVSSIHWWEKPGFLSIHIVLLFLTFFLSVIGWHRLLMTTGSYVSIKVAGFTWLTPNIGKYIPGKVFMVAGRIALLNRFGVRTSTAIGNIIWEHVFVVLAIMPFIFFVLLNNAGEFSLKTIIATIGVFILILSAVLNPRIIQRLINLVLRRFKKPPLDLSLKLKDILYFIIFYLIIWVGYGLTGVTLAYTFGFEDKVSMLLLFNVYIFSWFIGFISVVTPGGLGVREGVLILMISPYVPMAELIVFALFARVTWTVIELFGVIIGLILGNKLSAQPLKIIKSV
jgi:glycosyltransferase 2 family protein